MEECEETGGFLADSLGLQELLELLQLATRLGLLIIFILTILPILLLQKIQHLLMVDWGDRLQEGVGQIFVGKKRYHVVRRPGALG